LTWREPGDFCIEAPPQPLRIDRTTDALVPFGYGATQARLGDKLCLRRRLGYAKLRR
jgi:hypothetical protein